MSRTPEERWAVWFEAARLRTLSAAFAPVLVGTAAAHNLNWWRAAGALVVAVSLQVAVNFANDLFDARSGVDTKTRVGPRRATAAGLVSQKAMRNAIGIALIPGVAAGIALTLDVGSELLLVGALCIVAALAYSGGPRPYAAAGLGEVSVFVFFGLVATMGSAYVQDEMLSRVAYAAAIPIGFLATAILVVNNLRDIPTDEAANKRTFAVRIGAPNTRKLYQWLIWAAFIATFLVAAVARSYFPLLALLAIPVAGPPMRTIREEREPRRLIPALGHTARLQLVYAVLLATGLWLA